MIYSYSLQGLQAKLVQLEFQVRSGLPYFAIIGLASQSVQEAKDRVRCALEKNGFRCPLERKVVNIAPADLHKHGTHFDLAIALGILQDSQQISSLKKSYIYAGELGLNGELKDILGALPLFDLAQKTKIPLIIPWKTAQKYHWVKGIEYYAFEHLHQVVAFLESGILPVLNPEKSADENILEEDFALLGHESIRRILAIAVGGSHHVRMIGPPGAGKSLLARNMRSLRPALSYGERMELESLYSLFDKSHEAMLLAPFREINPAISFSGLFGGGVPIRPGEVSLAHKGILFMDEAPEFSRAHLEALRPVLESGQVLIRQAKQEAKFPADFQWVIAMNPCPCALGENSLNPCRCHPFEKKKYEQKLSAALLDRMDIHLGIQSESFSLLQNASPQNVEALKESIMDMKLIQKKRCFNHGCTSNRDLNFKWLKEETLSLKMVDFLDALSQKAWSTRRLLRMMRLARSIADFEKASFIQEKHFYEAYSYQKSLDPAI